MTIQRILDDREGGIVTITADQPVRDAVARLAERRIGALPVMAGDRPIGVFSERDLLHGLQTHGTPVLDDPVERVMTAPAVTVTPDTGALAALSLMTRRRIRHLPVVDSTGAMVGFVSIGDLVKLRIDRIEAEAESLRDYIAG